MDAPPAELFARNPVAFHLAAELREHPRNELTAADAARITGAPPGRARSAITALVELGMLEPARRGYYREPTAPTATAGKRARSCTWCGNALTGRQRLFCSHDCANHSHNSRRSAALAEQRADNLRRCIVCSTALDPKPRARHQLYCSRHCEYVAKGQ